MWYKIKRINSMKTVLGNYVKAKRKHHKITQEDLAVRANVGLRFVRDLEQGKKSLRMDKVNDVLLLFGAALRPVDITDELRELVRNNQEYTNRM